jgi:hypothetical protein
MVDKKAGKMVVTMAFQKAVKKAPKMVAKKAVRMAWK